MTQPEALRLADALDFEYADNGAGYNTEWTQGLQQAATELRRLHEVNQELLEACQTLVGLPNTLDWIETLHKAVQQARAAIAKAGGQQ